MKIAQCHIIPIHSRVLIILGNSRSPSDKRRSAPGIGSAYLRFGVLLQGFLKIEALSGSVVQKFITVYLTVHIKTKIIKSLFINSLIC